MERYGKELEFISQINRDGSGTTPLGDMSHNDKTIFDLRSLSLSKKTYIATEFNAFVVRLKNNPN